MDLSECIRRLTSSATTLRHMLIGVEQPQAEWKPVPGAWSLLEIVNHLTDEERDDFRRRLALTLEDPTRDWPAIDPEGWVTARDYASRDWQGSLEDFAAERQRSLDWLAGLTDVNWNLSRQHPQLGSLRAGDLMASWMAHDLLHERQVLRLIYDWTVHAGAPYQVDYAGGW